MQNKIKLHLTIIVTLLASSFTAKADEGMWLPINISKRMYNNMQQLGLELTPEQLYSINQSSLKDAIVSLGGFCTGEIVSKQGLMLTNWHCTEDVLQSHSTVENDLLTEGFWAQTMEDEKPNEGLYARFLVRMEDVTDQMLNALTPELNPSERRKIVDSISNVIVSEAIGDTFYDAQVDSYFEGNEYYLSVYETYRDVRLVGAPPSSIGYFGGDTDNWTWPRHTGDFAMFRIYMSPDGEPAQFSPENIPLKPRHFLPISLGGIDQNDFTMVMGFPGSTDRYLTSYGVKNLLQFNPSVVEIFQTRQDLLEEAMDADDEIRIKYSSKFFTLSNYEKYLIGQSEGLGNLDVVQQKEELEEDFIEWISKKKSRRKEFEDVLSRIEVLYDSINKYQIPYDYARFSQYLVEIIPFAYSFQSLKNQLSQESPNESAIERLKQAMLQSAESYFGDYHAPLDKKVFTEILKLYAKNVSEEMQPDILVEHKNDIVALADKVYNNSAFTSYDKLESFLNNVTAEKIENDPAFEVAISFINNYRNVGGTVLEFDDKLNDARRELISGLRVMNEDADFYPDANSTLRLTYGSVQSYDPKDAVHYNYYTTLQGVVEKDQPGNKEFDAPEKLLELQEDQEFGIYDENGVMRLAFISTNDITGGNSGSPVINGQGELVGIAFDGNWEAMSGDIAFEPELQRSINVDIRYVLFVMDKFAEADHLIQEMELVDVPTNQKKKEKVSN